MRPGIAHPSYAERRPIKSQPCNSVERREKQKLSFQRVTATCWTPAGTHALAQGGSKLRGAPGCARHLGQLGPRSRCRPPAKGCTDYLPEGLLAHLGGAGAWGTDLPSQVSMEWELEAGVPASSDPSTWRLEDPRLSDPGEGGSSVKMAVTVASTSRDRLSQGSAVPIPMAADCAVPRPSTMDMPSPGRTCDGPAP